MAKRNSTFRQMADYEPDKTKHENTGIRSRYASNLQKMSGRLPAYRAAGCGLGKGASLSGCPFGRLYRCGEVAEWFKAVTRKVTMRGTASEVRILPLSASDLCFLASWLSTISH
jgi:hypothetical protein